jgi:Monoamine oxidase
MQLRQQPPHQHRPPPLSLKGALFLLALISVAAITEGNALTHCAFLTQAPIIEYDLPSYQYKLKFLDVDAKVYRTTLTTGTTPRIRILKYSANPVIDHDDDTQEILISTEGSSCISSSSSDGSKIFARPLISYLMTALAIGVTGAQFGFSGWTTGGALLGASTLLAFHSGSSFASAADACTPALEIVVEAPPYYLGSVDSCLAEVENPDHCPLPFPTFEECSDPTPTCKVAVIGAGTGGLYTAMRLVEEGKVAGSDVCIFEATDRVGGRLYSLRGFGPENDISVDAGGYRTWPQYTVSTTVVCLLVNSTARSHFCFFCSTHCCDS